MVLALPPFVAAAQEQETWNAHFQSTYIWQKKPSFSSRYEGPHSLSGGAEKSYSFTAICQRISHPGYNADRGPVSFYALRLHWENWK